MIIRGLDENGDFMMGKGKSNFLVDDAAIALNIKTRIQSWLGNCFFAPGEGVDWYNRLGSKNQQELLDMELRAIISKSFGVTGIIDLHIFLDRDTRNFIAEYSITTINNDEFLISTALIGVTNA